ncbi:hypothetical protein A464_693 [Salmonella bongori N268-08]|uniref:Uncharacterized protein n=1 Tax=Salmonella bongori N268-08 TaxID=1197719 RepID=S5MTA0_SALBN|nr:hypothetical protein A464_693 [Salmonella bongori N268-08]
MKNELNLKSHNIAINSHTMNYGNRQDIVKWAETTFLHYVSM